MAHSYVTSFQAEIEAFRAFSRVFPGETVLLIDTYDTVEGAKKAALVGQEMLREGNKIRGVRLDSGDIAALSRDVRKILTEAGLAETMIFASGGLDEHEIASILENGGDVDAFGVGTKMGVSADAPYTDCAYKLVSYDGRPVLKLSEGKRSLVCDKQVFRIGESDTPLADVITLRTEAGRGEPMLQQVMRAGRRLGPEEPLSDIRERFRREFSGLDDCYKDIMSPALFPVALSPALEKLEALAVAAVRRRELGES
jgi:nicotinate phosphoribosyltransferase